ncbi:MAG: rhomboid family intramembrane serine protease [Burkholderiales bacterium]
MDLERTLGMTPWVRRLVVANLVVFLLQHTVFLRLPLAYGFVPLEAFTRPWTFVTYMFVHDGVLHLAFNMLALFWLGSAVEERLGGAGFIAYYLWCGLGGAVLSYALMQVVPVSLVVGASGAIYGVAYAFARFWPDRPMYVFPLPNPIPAKWLVTFLVALSLVLALRGARDGVAHLAHLGGFAAGFLVLTVQDLRLARAERHLRRASQPGVLVHPAARAARGSRPETGRGAAPTRTRPRTGDATHAEIDRVLDKISAQGMGSLTPAERKFLAEMSRQMRSKET